MPSVPIGKMAFQSSLLAASPSRRKQYCSMPWHAGLKLARKNYDHMLSNRWLSFTTPWFAKTSNLQHMNFSPAKVQPGNRMTLKYLAALAMFSRNASRMVTITPNGRQEVGMVFTWDTCHVTLEMFHWCTIQHQHI